MNETEIKVIQAFEQALLGHAGTIKMNGYMMYIYIMGTRMTVKFKAERQHLQPEVYMYMIDCIPIKSGALDLRLDKCFSPDGNVFYYWITANQYFKMPVIDFVKIKEAV